MVPPPGPFSAECSLDVRRTRELRLRVNRERAYGLRTAPGYS